MSHFSTTMISSSPPISSPATIHSTHSFSSHPNPSSHLIPPHVLLPPAPPHPHPTYVSYIHTWSHPQIASFLFINKCAHHAPAFEANDITGEVLMELGDKELRELGVGKVGERVRLVGGIRGLRKRCVGGGGGGESVRRLLANGGDSGRISPAPSLARSNGHGSYLLTSPSTVNGLGYGSSLPGYSGSTSSPLRNVRGNPPPSRQHAHPTSTSASVHPQPRLNDDALNLSSSSTTTNAAAQNSPPPFPDGDRDRTTDRQGSNGSTLGMPFPTSSLSRSSSLSNRSRPRDTRDRGRPSTGSSDTAVISNQVDPAQAPADDSIISNPIGNSAGSRRLNAARPPPLHLAGNSASDGHGSGNVSAGSGELSSGDMRRNGDRRERERDGRVEIGSSEARERERERERNRLGQVPVDNLGHPAANGSATRYASNGPLQSATRSANPQASTPRGTGPTSQPLATSASTGSNDSSGSAGSLVEYLSSAIVIGQHTPSPGIGITPVSSGRPSMSSSLTVTPGTLYTSSSSSSSGSGATGSVPGPLPSSALSTGLRAPSSHPSGTSLGGRRSPSPAFGGPGDVSSFADRPLPGIPPAGSGQSDAYPAVTRGFGERRANLAAARLQAGGRPSTSGQIGSGSNVPESRPRRRSGSLVDAEAGVIAAFGRSSHTRPTRPSTSGSSGQGTNTAMERHPYANPDNRGVGSKTIDARRKNSDESSPRRNDRFGSSSAATATPTTADTWNTSSSRNRTGSTDQSRGQANAPMSLEDVRRKCVKFILADDGSSRVVNLETCEGGMEVLERALKKFGKWKGVGTSRPGSESEGEGDEGTSLNVDGWGVFMSEFDDENESELASLTLALPADSMLTMTVNDSVRALTEAELLAICHADPGDPSRQNGLWLRRLRRSANRKDITNFLGENTPMSPTSPAGYYPSSASRAAFPSPTKDKAQSRQPLGRSLNRASMISVMSGLGAVAYDDATTPSAQQDFPAPARSPSTGNFLASKGKKMYNFFGHRPPSEMISSHLADYFPAARRRDLEKGARNSMLRIDGKGSNSLSNRASYGSGSLRDSLDVGVTPNRLPSRFSIASSSASSSRLSRSSASMIGTPIGQTAPIPENQVLDTIPRVSISTDDGEIRPIQTSPNKAPLLPPLEAGGESLTDSLKIYSPLDGTASKPRLAGSVPNKNRLSMTSTFRRRRRSNASMLTVDEITAEVDQRRASVISFGGSDDDAEEELVSGIGAAIDPGIAPKEEGEDYEEELEDEEEESESASEEEEVDEDEDDEEQKTEEEEQRQKFTSAGANRSIKWSKGALVGSGSFGQVYLGLDLQKGLLMAVKQVDIRTGSNPASENRKKEMIVALQREIELLKELQHENIVQYLDSSTDEQFLNIFLEYVPGGSVTALLRSYGAFEEALVRTFVRQILTGLQYLHDKDIIHRDIKGANILVDNKGGVKISDFGISKKTETNLLTGKANRASLQGSAFWMAPEVVKQAPYTFKADIWSVGCLVLEMLTGEHPWPELNQMQAFFRIGGATPRPTLPADISSEAANMLDRSFEIDQVKRPSATELLQHPFLRSE